jgi:glycosyltransferase 2 family protein
MRLGIRAHLLANLGKYLPGKVLHAVALVAMAREAGVASAVGVTSILLEVLLTVIGAGLVALFGLAVTMSDQRWAITSLAVVSLGAALVILHPRVLSFVLAAAARFVPAARGRLERVELPYATMLTLLGLYVASWALVALGLFATAAAVHPLAPELFVGLTGITAFGYLVGLAVPFAPAGVGAREGTTAFLLSTVLGVPLPAAAAVSVLARFIAILAEMTAALVASRL